MDTEPAQTDAEYKAQMQRAEDDAELVRRAKEFYRIGTAATSEWRKSAIDDLEFLAGRQWDPIVKGNRDASGRPALTVNRLPQFVRQVTNEQRQSKPAVTVSPVDSSSDIRTAEVLQGVIRNIEVSSNADAAYASGGQSAAITGLGYWDVGAEFEDEKSFEQRLVIRRIKNPMSVVMDPSAKEVAGDDARQAILSSDISLGEWKSKFPNREAPAAGDWDGEGDSAASWVAKDGVRLHEYRYITDEPDTLIDIPAGYFQDMPEGGPALESELEPAVAKALHHAGANARPTTRRKACWAKIAGDEVVERGEFAGQYLQVVRVVGGELDIDGETIFEGVIRHAKDSQRMLNYFVSSEAEAIALTPKAPWVGTLKQFEGYESAWETANTRAHSYLVFNPDPLNPGPPQRVMAEANVQAITNARMQAADDLKATTGIYDGQLGARSNETSGRAILARQNQGQTANFHFQDNLGMAIRYTGRILVDLIPKVYTGPRVLRILGEDGQQDMVPVNGDPGKMPTKLATKPGPIELNAGRYDVTVSMGPSYQTRRQEAAAQMTELLKVNPSASPLIMDLLVRSMDIPGGGEIADRLQKMLPPEIRPQDAEQPPAQILAQKVAELERMNQQMTQALHEMSERAESKTLELQSQERKDLIAKRVDLAKAFASSAPEDMPARTLLLQQMRVIDQDLMAHFAPAPEQPQSMQMQQQPMQPPMPMPQGGQNGF